MSQTVVKVLSGEQAMVEFGRQLGKLIVAPMLIFLRGDLGAGKTTLCRGILGAFGHKGPVKSPTYTLVEPYQFGGDGLVYHFDLYRLGDPEELEFIGIRDYLSQGGCCLVEWPERGAGMLPLPDLQITITAVEDGRRLSITCNTPKGETVLASLPEPG
ncbi:MAG: tRNA (adenosine(37)-N6)-threonylcarbamoyltransferase complex ATPase subunit type 1 TsaE [Porticoccus sp.]|jgi:tRNA threonylcarbamoyladenosine biosynthesis protein TsaE|uniref:tRNA (adenosine(37)-N6)-threonylcarbamoyltransferase complex ATPase subunit type 1 TsaE n=1 Tax=Porticoccus TaxID=1123967 RepID=UPI000560E35D|nr:MULTISPECIES: tRNA (adenosine(37)-N6)-threonylcarbamoyltransferase complex ATPase subunit type 1 TsaE [Porticoccus]MAZ69349.1 tRNA (adenosine(37)-N6)-threonylcarbamoyltransferase complex ATPase subunit type 1 TsaE [Porticoccus sp.]MBG57387.1 tRNA (adenosine(37)-N6)-threonylcarbamoyltransferase complex ATPase subunit type 1 TsaE [Porticoccus sp.]|tara:strand:- start:2809 stop:3282 length:474 start_codon:yes stop_codon:yes gene_type:complete